MTKTRKVLLINAHLTYPNWTEGTLNNSFILKAKVFFESKNFEVLNTKIEDGYNPEDEVEKHMQADIVILQTPVNWFGAPWIYKKYVDEVFNTGLHSLKFLASDGRTRKDATRQYGTGGYLQGKKFMICGTWNAPKEAFGNIDQNYFKVKKQKIYFCKIQAVIVFAVMTFYLTIIVLTYLEVTI